MKELLFHLRINALMMDRLMMISGHDYAILQWGHDPKFLADVIRTKTYWKWWERNFMFRNLKLVHKHNLILFAKDDEVSDSVWYLFEYAHNAEEIKHYPNQVIMDMIMAEFPNAKPQKKSR